MLIVNETKKISKSDSFTASISETPDEICKVSNGNNHLSKFEKKNRTQKYRDSKNDASSLMPLIVQPLLSTTATLLSVLPSLPPHEDELAVSKGDKMVCKMSDSPFFIHKV